MNPMSSIDDGKECSVGFNGVDGVRGVGGADGEDGFASSTEPSEGIIPTEPVSMSKTKGEEPMAFRK